MARLTLRSMVKSILNAMDSDDINDIDDTEEALQVVDIIKNTYYELMSQKKWNHLKLPINLEGLSDIDYPTTLKIPDEVVSISDVRYECREDASDRLNYKQLTYKCPEDFTDYVLNRDSTSSEVQSLTVKGSGAPLFVQNDRAPTFWTSYDETYIVFDSYNSDVENTMQGNKSLVYCVRIPEFDDTDGDYIPECNINMFPVLLAEAQRACFVFLKQQDSPIDSRRALRGYGHLKNSDYRAHERRKSASFGRR